LTYRRRRSSPDDSVRPEFDEIVASVTPGHARTLSAVLDWAIAETRADFGDIQLVHHHDGSLRIVVQRGFDMPFLQFFRIVKNDESSCAATMKQARQIVVRDVTTSPLFKESARRVMLEQEVLACQSTPIVSSDGRVIGILSTHYRRPTRPTERQLRRVAEMARYVGELLERHVLSVSTSVDVSALVDEIRDGSPKTKTIRG
jgi:GAF domain-containing protein